MRRLIIVVALLPAALALSGCSARVQTPKPPRPPFHVSVSLTSRTATDNADIKHLLDVPSTWDAKAKVWRRLAKVTLLSDDVRARKAFPGALFPRDTLGRKLLAIADWEGGPGMVPQHMLTLLYEGGLRVTERRGPLDWGSTRGSDVRTRTVKVGTTTATIEAFPASGNWVWVKWQVGSDREYAVGGQDFSDEQLLRVARSLAP